MDLTLFAQPHSLSGETGFFSRKALEKGILKPWGSGSYVELTDIGLNLWRAAELIDENATIKLPSYEKNYRWCVQIQTSSILVEIHRIDYLPHKFSRAIAEQCYMRIDLHGSESDIRAYIERMMDLQLEFPWLIENWEMFFRSTNIHGNEVMRAWDYIYDSTMVVRKDTQYSGTQSVSDVEDSIAKNDLPGLLSALRSEHEDARFSAIRALLTLAEQGYPVRMVEAGAITVLVESLDDDAIFIKPRPYKPVIFYGLADLAADLAGPAKEYVLEYASVALGIIAGEGYAPEVVAEGAIPKLIRLLDHEDADVKNHAIYALAGIAQGNVIERMVQAGVIPKIIPLLHLSNAVALVKSISNPMPEALMKYQVELKKHGNTKNLAKKLMMMETQPEVVDDVEGKGNDIAGLLPFLEEKNGFIRWYATRVIGKKFLTEEIDVTNDRTIQKLVGLLHDKDEMVRFSAEWLLNNVALSNPSLLVPYIAKFRERRETEYIAQKVLRSPQKYRIIEDFTLFFTFPKVTIRDPGSKKLIFINGELLFTDKGIVLVDDSANHRMFLPKGNIEKIQWEMWEGILIQTNIKELKRNIFKPEGGEKVYGDFYQNMQWYLGFCKSN